MNQLKLEPGAIAWLIVLLLVISSISTQASIIRKDISINYNSLEEHLDDNTLEEIWMSYVKIYEGDWIHFNFMKDRQNKENLSYKNCKQYATDVIAYFLKKGMPRENVIMKYSPTAMVVVYKEPGYNINANLISIDTTKLQYFTFINQDGAVCETKAGNHLIFPPYSFLGDKNGKVVLTVAEFSTKRDFFESGFTSTSNNRLLCSNGMFEISASCNNKPTDLKPGASASIKFHENNLMDRENDLSYLSFYGEKEKGIINWQANYAEKISMHNSESGNKIPPNKLQSASKRSVKVTYTEITYVQLSRKLKLIESNLFNRHPDFDITETDYNYLVAKYGVLQYGKDINLTPIKDFKHFQKIIKDEPSFVFMGLNQEQKENLNAKQAEEDEKRKKELEELDRAQKEAQAKYEQEEANKRPLEMKLSQLGSINCDRFYGEDSITNVMVKIDDEDYDQIKVYVVFTNINSVMHGYYRPEHKGIIRFDKIPAGQAVIYIAATFKGDQVKLAYISKNIETNETVPLVLSSYSKLNYERILDDLIPN